MAPKRGCFHGSTSAAASPPSRDAIFEILSWLPARSLGRARCVCRLWRAMISDPAFLATHRSRAEPLLASSTYTARDAGTTSVQIRDTDGHLVRHVDLAGMWKFRLSLGNLALLSSFHDMDSPAVCVVDLASGETVASFPKIVQASNRVTTWFGLGRAAHHKVLRVVLWSIWIGYERLTCEVLTLGDGDSEWRQTSSPPQMVCHSYNFKDGVAIGGVVNFLAESQEDILSFDLEREVWAVVHGLPAGTLGPDPRIGLAELNGTLCIILHTKSHGVTLWLLTEKHVWVKAYTIPFDLFFNLPTDRRVINVVPLSVTRDGGKLLFYYRYDYRRYGDLKLYDPRSGKCTDVEKAPTDIEGRIGHCSSSLDPRLCG